MGVELILSFPSKDRASFGLKQNPGHFIVNTILEEVKNKDS